jgi:hypothetical protein
MEGWAVWLEFWDWFFSYTEFFAVVFGPIILGSLVLVLVAAALLGVMFGLVGWVGKLLSWFINLFRTGN